jgi:hypothetical protein
MMKRFGLVLSFLCLLTISLKAQVGEYRNDFAIGGTAGYVLSQVGFMPEVPQKMHGGLIGGLALRYTCEKYFNSICAVTAEVNYAQLGWKEELLTPNDQPVINSVTELAEEYERTIDYIQVPVFARLGWGRERKGVQAFFQVGPQVGFYLNERTKTNFNFNERNAAQRTSQIVSQDTMSVQRTLDYGIAGGAGVEFSHPKLGHFILEGRYYYGLGDIYNNSKRDYFGRSNLTNIVVKLTYLFDVKKTNNPKIK